VPLKQSDDRWKAGEERVRGFDGHTGGAYSGFTKLDVNTSRPGKEVQAAANPKYGHIYAC